MAGNGGSGKIPAWTPAGGICGRFGAVGRNPSCMCTGRGHGGGSTATRRGGVGGDRSSRAFMAVVGARGASRLGGATAGGAGQRKGGGAGPRARRAGDSGALG
jgi:hypothetical protein